ncbi:hypothetical protein ESA94_01090 [Lacibacter luteus]|uniref:Uncharacterized protein n=1 Tax=Lacibacter luteus TaxID=2508719 RepID=A0A4Q1CLV6_9BACT|nr:hypothetical protein [Lacibacter luteus]RXK61641.1 hypothetical protein ESA94_01090 [Lacibacter luteus]
MKYFLLCLLFLITGYTETNAQVWQWSVSVDCVISSETNDHPQAYLWIPENCKQVRAVVFAQHNMIEEGMLEHAHFRKTMRELGIAEVWVTPGINMSFDFTKDAGEDFEYMMKKLADVSGYKELASVPVIPLGHSAYATFPWNFAAWNPQRTLALVSIHGDAPQTHLTGYGRANVEWGNRTIDGVPALFIMGEYEWWEDRITPAFNYIAKHPNSAISLFCDAGHGHFDYSDEMITYVCMFIKKAAAKRLPSSMSIHKPNILLPVKAEQGWLMDRWHKDSLPEAAAAKYSAYKGERKFASWVFDKEMADATEAFYAKVRGKQQQYIGFKQEGAVIQPDKSHANYNIKFKPQPDGISFTLSAFFSDSTKLKKANKSSNQKLIIDRICGPVKKINDTTFQISFNRLGFNNAKRSFDVWLLASSKADNHYKSSVQQINMKIPHINNIGTDQHIQFDSIPSQKSTVKSLNLSARSSADEKIQFFVKEGPAFISNSTLHITAIPPRTKFPVKVTVVAWQYGIEGKTKTAAPVTRTFYILK